MKKIFTYLIATAALMIVSAAAMAQGGLAPFVGSTHEYTITPESTSNTLTWSVTEGSGYTINSQTVVTTTSVANIIWTAAGTYHLQFTEYDGTCSTVKEITVVVGNNTFDVSTTNPLATCNAADGQVNFAGTTATTGVTFTVSMATGNSAFNPDWNFTFTLTSVSGATISNVKVGAAVLTGSGPYTAPDQSSASGLGSVTVTCDAEGGINDLQDVVLTITSATELAYNTPDVDTNDWTATQTIDAIPNTSTITTD